MQNLNEIPLYLADESCVGLRTLKRINELLAMEMITVVKDRRGNIRRAYYRQQDGKSSIRPTAHMGQAYVVNELLPTGHHAFKHKRLPKGKADLFVRDIFRRVALDCIAP